MQLLLKMSDIVEDTYDHFQIWCSKLAFDYFSSIFYFVSGDVHSAESKVWNSKLECDARADEMNDTIRKSFDFPCHKSLVKNKEVRMWNTYNNVLYFSFLKRIFKVGSMWCDCSYSNGSIPCIILPCTTYFTFWLNATN